MDISYFTVNSKKKCVIQNTIQYSNNKKYKYLILQKI